MWGVMSGVAKLAWDVMSGVTKTAWDVLSGMAYLCGMFCPGWQKMAWDVLSRDVLSGSRIIRSDQAKVGTIKERVKTSKKQVVPTLCNKLEWLNHPETW